VIKRRELIGAEMANERSPETQRFEDLASSQLSETLGELEAVRRENEQLREELKLSQSLRPNRGGTSSRNDARVSSLGEKWSKDRDVLQSKGIGKGREHLEPEMDKKSEIRENIFSISPPASNQLISQSV
jgi:hypothetical protein